MLQKSALLLPMQKITIALFLFVTLIGNSIANAHTTEVIKASVINIEPIYMNYTLKKVVTPCDSRKPRCWNVSYEKETAKVLKGYRVKLSYKNNTFTARMLNEPTDEYLKIRVKSDLLVIPSTVAINAAVVY